MNSHAYSERYTVSVYASNQCIDPSFKEESFKGGAGEGGKKGRISNFHMTMFVSTGDTSSIHLQS